MIGFPPEFLYAPARNLSSMQAELHLVDAFTSSAFRGNTAGVCIPDGPADAAWMQQVAAELKHSETAFLFPEERTGTCGGSLPRRKWNCAAMPHSPQRLYSGRPAVFPGRNRLPLRPSPVRWPSGRMKIGSAWTSRQSRPPHPCRCLVLAKRLGSSRCIPAETGLIS